MKKHKVDLVIADTEAYVLANNAIIASLSRFDFSSVYVFTDRVDLWPQYQTVKIPKITCIDDYNEVILSKLPEVVSGDYCVVAQYDGFVMNPEGFSEHFYDCDYIGAVWPGYPCFRVGNGGFSWRSRRLIDAAGELATIRRAGEPEDVFICRAMRVLLEDRYGCHFADEPLAQQFSYEILGGGPQSFGFHGVFNLPLVYRDALSYLVENLPDRVIREKMGFLNFGAGFLDGERRREFEQCCLRRLAAL